MKIISFEGLDGSGKTTQCRLLADALRKNGARPISLREPGDTYLGEKIRDILRDSAPPISQMAQMLLYAAARAELVELGLKPYKPSSLIVILDRYMDSSLAYQGYGHGLPRGLTRQINAAVVGRFEPNLTIFLDVPVSVAMARTKIRALTLPGLTLGPAATPCCDTCLTEEQEQVQTKFLHAVREGYLDILSQSLHRIVLVDGCGSREKTAALIWNVVRERRIISVSR